MRINKGIWLMVAGLVCIILAILLMLFNLRQDKLAENVSAELLKDFVLKTEEKTDTSISVSDDSKMVCGIITIPAIDIELPVLLGCSDDGLKTAPCRYIGWPKDENFVICAHNYASHFGRLFELKEGDAVIYVDEEGVTWNYTVAGVETILPNSIEYLQSGDWPLSLFTCTLGGQARFVVRCDFAQ